MRTPAEIETAFDPADRIRADKPFYLVGIGGAGMSSLAFMLQKRGIEVAGSDSTVSPTTSSLLEAGIPVRIGHSGEDIRSDHQVVLSDAIDLKSSPEVEAARKLGCPLFRRSQLLNWLLEGKKIIAVTGTHGKTTVTGMIGAGLRAAGMDPTIVVGAYVPEFGGSVIEGSGEYAVVEACEAYNALLDFEPYMVVLTNLEPDHLDFHGDFESLRSSVSDFVKKLDGSPHGGCFIYCADDKGSHDLADSIIGSEGHGYEADFYTLAAYADHPPDALPPLALPGKHNALNAQGAFRAAVYTDADPALVAKGIAEFRGAERRLQAVQSGEIEVIDDYAHHPVEIEASLSAIRERYPDRRLIVVFQPHLYSRTAQFIPEFAKALSLADVVFLTDIYPAREEPIPGISSARIAELIEKPCFYIPSRHLLPREVAQVARSGDVVVGMGAGNIAEFAPGLIEELKRGASRVGLQASGSALDARRPTPNALRIAVIYGGDSAEREVSILSGRAILEALTGLGHDAFTLDVADALLGKGELKELVGSKRPELAFLATHGTNQEDGALQGLFELLHIPYTGSGIQASALAMDKQMSKRIFEANGMPVPRGVLVDRFDAEISLDPPLIVKPNAQGSTVGLSFVATKADLRDAIRKALRYDRQALVEEQILGMEISVPVLGDRALPPVEICPKEGGYDFANKYTPGATEEIVPARLPQSVLEKAQEYAIRAHRALCCRGATRTDFIVRDGQEPVVLEVNTLPGMTGTSLLPNSARAAGMSFEDLVQWIVDDALSSSRTYGGGG